MAAGIAAVPLPQIAHDDGTPRFEFMRQANRAFGAAETRNAGNPGYQPYPAGAPRHLGLVAEAILAERAAIRAAVSSAMAAPGTSPEAAEVAMIIERARAGESARAGGHPAADQGVPGPAAVPAGKPGIQSYVRSRSPAARRTRRWPPRSARTWAPGTRQARPAAPLPGRAVLRGRGAGQREPLHDESRINSARAAKTWKTSRPPGVVVHPYRTGTRCRAVQPGPRLTTLQRYVTPSQAAVAA
jgi:hypothetical protein